MQRLIYYSLLLFATIFSIVAFHACTTPPVDGPLRYLPIDEGLPCEEGIISFRDEVLPLIVSNCAYSGCHDAETAEEDIILDSYENIMMEVEPNKPNKSELYEYLFEEGDERMPPPPNDPLTSTQKDLIKDWINQGARNTACDGPCDPDKSSFSADIFPIIKSFCIGCHSNTQALGGVNLSNYAEIKPYIDNEEFIGTIEHLSGYSPMPPSGGKMSTCRIEKIKKWIDEGAQDN